MVWSQFSIVIQFGVYFGNSVLDNSNWDKISHNLTKKLNPWEESGAHLRISFWHLLMNFENPKKQTFEILSLYTCTKNHNLMSYSYWDKKWDRVFCHFGSFFCPFNPLPPNNPENQNFEEMKKGFGDIIFKKTGSYDVCLLRYKALTQT